MFHLRTGIHENLPLVNQGRIRASFSDSISPIKNSFISLAEMKFASLQVLSLLILIMASVAEALPVVAIQPLGRVNPQDLARVQAGIRALYAVDAELLPEMPMPQTAYYPPRERYKADKLLDSLELAIDKRFTKVIGLTARDISTSKDDIDDWGIFGLGSLGGRCCVVSTYRLRAGKPSNPVFQARLVKVVNHELGHTFGLDHCPAVGCLMQDAGGKIATVDGESGIPCAACAARMLAVK